MEIIFTAIVTEFIDKNGITAKNDSEMKYLINICNWHVKKSRASSVGIALGYGLDDRGSRV
jgi:hypothetical protein